jgi:hemoglobin-like flavoprotein
MADSEQSTIDGSLEAIAETGVDIVPLVYECYFATTPAALEHFGIAPGDELPIWAGHMINELLLCLISDDEADLRSRAFAVTTTHCGKGIDSGLYRSLCECVVQVVADLSGDAFGAAQRQAWNARVDRLMALVDVELAAEQAWSRPRPLPA